MSWPLRTTTGSEATCRRWSGFSKVASSVGSWACARARITWCRPDGWRARRAESGGGVFLDHGLPLLDLALWLADFPEPQRVSAHMDRGRGGVGVEDSMLVHLECAPNLSCSFDISWSYVGEQDRWWFEVLAARGSARLAPLRVVKSLNGRPTDVSPTGAAARESVFLQSYRAELAHFVAVLQGEAKYEAPSGPGHCDARPGGHLSVGRRRPRDQAVTGRGEA